MPAASPARLERCARPSRPLRGCRRGRRARGCARRRRSRRPGCRSSGPASRPSAAPRAAWPLGVGAGLDDEAPQPCGSDAAGSRRRDGARRLAFEQGLRTLRLGLGRRRRPRPRGGAGAAAGRWPRLGARRRRGRQAAEARRGLGVRPAARLRPAARPPTRRPPAPAARRRGAGRRPRRRQLQRRARRRVRGISIGMSTAIGRGWVSNSSGKPTMPTPTSTAAPISRRRARVRAACTVAASSTAPGWAGLSLRLRNDSTG